MFRPIGTVKVSQRVKDAGPFFLKESIRFCHLLQERTGKFQRARIGDLIYEALLPDNHATELRDQTLVVFQFLFSVGPHGGVTPNTGALFLRSAKAVNA